ncbi:MAG: CAP domain-containing protein [Acidobacteriaceae bacterium]
MNPTERRAADELFAAANQDRVPQGLRSLRRDAALDKAAWQHAQRMVESGGLSHRVAGEADLVERVQQAGAHSSTVAENVAQAPTAAQINDEWMHSASHRANLLDPRVNAVGIAVIERHGELYAVQDFARETAALTPAGQEKQVASLLRTRGLQIASDGAAARAYCAKSPSGTRPLPKLVMRYSTTDLSDLPQQVQQGIASGSYHRAAVGACGAASQNGFSAYQMVILLY